MSKSLYRGFCRNDGGKETIYLNGGEAVKGYWIESENINTQYDINGNEHRYMGLWLCSSFYPKQKNISWKEVIPETVSEALRGATDKNGQQVFEGDILKAITIDTNQEQFAIVGFGKFVDVNNDVEYIGFYIDFDGEKTTACQLMLEEVKDRFEVIGTKWDNYG